MESMQIGDDVLVSACLTGCTIALTGSFTYVVQAWGWPFLLRLAAAHRRRRSRPTSAHPPATGVHAVLPFCFSSFVSSLLISVHTLNGSKVCSITHKVVLGWSPGFLPIAH